MLPDHRKKLDAAERKKNLQKAFQVVGNPAGMRILLIDDVYTTGSTMDVLAKLLLEKGASHVYFSRCVLETTGKKMLFMAWDI